MTQRVWNALHSAADTVPVAWPSPEKAGTTCSIRIEVALLSSWRFGGTRDGTGFLRNLTDVGSLSGRASMRYSRIFPNRETSEATTWIYMLTLKETFQCSYKYTFLNFYYNHACEGRGPSWNQFKDLLWIGTMYRKREWLDNNFWYKVQWPAGLRSLDFWLRVTCQNTGWVSN